MVARARWRLLADEIESGIRSGAIELGAQLPSLVDQAKVGYSQTTTLRAYSHLASRGLVTTVHGTGTFVVDVLPPTRGTVEERLDRIEAWIAARDAEQDTQSGR